MVILEEGVETLHRWTAVAERAWRDGRDIAGALEQAFQSELAGLDPLVRERLDTLNGVHSNAAGLRLWLEKTKGPAATS